MKKKVIEKEKEKKNANEKQKQMQKQKQEKEKEKEREMFRYWGDKMMRTMMPKGGGRSVMTCDMVSVLGLLR